ncbi:5-formyltetrahydrofolate cyclo-ligase [Lysobacteraceae bacterium NML91-0213]|nr:5-formyltetrahydrofolate cyclo-ligase [Xanthomonadaceae bacterium NML91-0213]
MTLDRDALRRELRHRRRDVPPAQRIHAAEAVAARLDALPFMPTQGYVAGYWAMDGEVALHVWQLRLPSTLVYCLPVLHEDGRLRFAPWRAGASLVTNRYGIPEPDVESGACLDAGDIALAVLPLVAFDGHGQRLGMGAGWYDRTFAERRGRAGPPWLAGAAYAFQQTGPLDAREWDVPLDAVCTDTDTLLPADP